MTTTTTPDDHAPRTRAEIQEQHHHDAPERRPLSVGHVWLVGLVCLLVGALLNASGIRKTALSQPVGWKRDAATAVADPLYDASHALRLDSLRKELQDLIGRSGADDVDLTLPSPTIDLTTPPVDPDVPTTTTTLPPKRAFSPTTQMRLWVGGDSLSISPGESVINQALATLVIGILQSVDGHVATGLARPEVFNWSAHLAAVVASTAPDSMVLALGSNDDQAMTGAGGVGPFGSAEWQAEYRRRVGGLMDQVTGSGAVTLFWVGIPQMRNVERYETRYKLINEIIKTEAELRPGKVYFVDTASLLIGPDGGYADFVAHTDGTIIRLRAADGIHFERAGADLVAAAVLTRMNEAFDLTSWQTTATTTAPVATTLDPTTTVPSTSTTKPKTSKKSG